MDPIILLFQLFYNSNSRGNKKITASTAACISTTRPAPYTVLGDDPRCEFFKAVIPRIEIPTVVDYKGD